MKCVHRSFRTSKTYNKSHLTNDKDNEEDQRMDTNVEIAGAVDRAKALGLCLRRIWAIAASLPDRENSLPKLIPPLDMISISPHSTKHQEHEQCTFDFCEHSRIDFTFVEQRHEQDHGDAMDQKNCSCLDFPLSLARDRVKQGKSAVWKLHDLSLLDSSHPYMALSHVWADGTGTGAWGPGKVHECLFKFFCDIANEFQCEGCWWDTISIPSDDEARATALANMHSNYADARITLVHDLYLRNWEWIDAETACFAIVMSPWYSRGWTALELAKSHKVKILFKATNGRHIVKDLDIDILHKIQPESPQHETAESIRKLRAASIQTLSDLLGVLGPRDTSKPRDMPVIAGLLAGVDVYGGLSQQEIYQRILRKLGRVAQEHLFHNSATMSTPGFSWCPTNIFDMPVYNGLSESLKVQENGDVEGFWRAYETNAMGHEDFNWKDAHPLMKVFLESALQGESREKHVFLVEDDGSRNRALLVKTMAKDGNTYCCRFIGPVYFNKELDGDGSDIRVRIGSTEGMKGLPGSARDFLPPPDEDRSAEDTKSTDYESSDAESKANSEGSRNGTAILYFEEKTIEWPFEKTSGPETSFETAELRLESSKMQLHVQYQPSNVSSSAKIRTFFYGHRETIPFIKGWLESIDHQTPAQSPRTKELMLLNIDEVRQITIDGGSKDRLSVMASEALIITIAKAEGSYAAPLVTFLLDHHAKHTWRDRTPLHTAVKNRKFEIIPKLLGHKTNPASVDAVDKYYDTAIHLAAGLPLPGANETHLMEAQMKSAELLVNMSKACVTQRNLGNMTALHIAAEDGNHRMVRCLLQRAGKIKPLPDLEACIGLHAPKHEVHMGNKEVLDDSPQQAFFGRPKSPEAQAVSGSADGEPDMPFHLEREFESDIDSQLRRSLQLAVENGHRRVVHILISCGARLHGLEEGNPSALVLAAEKGHVGTINDLLKAFCGSFETNEINEAFLQAAQMGYRRLVKKLDQHGAESGYQDEHGMTALHWAIYREHDSITKLLIKKGPLDLKCSSNQHTPLTLAIAEKRKNIVSELLRVGANVDLCDSDGRTALHWAAIKEDKDAISKLIESGENNLLNLQDKRGRTALHWAARHGSLEAMDIIISANAHCSMQDNNQKTPLILAAEKGQCKAVEKLLAHGASNPDARDSAGMTALDRAAFLGNDTIANMLILKTKTDEDRVKALHLAAKERHLSLAISLCENIRGLAVRSSAISGILFSAASIKEISPQLGIFFRNVENPNATQAENGQTALMLSAIHGNRLLISKLVEMGADINLKDNMGRTALIMAVKKQHFDTVEFLLSLGADTTVQDNQGRTALHHVLLDSLQRTKASHTLHYRLKTKRRLSRREKNTWKHTWRVIQGVLSYDANIYVKDKEDQTPMHLATLHGEQVALDLLELAKRSKSIIPNDVKDAEGRSLLLLAAEKGYGRLVTMLGSGDLNLADKSGKTPLLSAADKGHHRVVQWFLEGGANPNLQDLQGNTALLQAAQNGHSNVVASILAYEQGTKLNLDAQDIMGRTALLHAASNGYYDIVVQLLQHGADPNLPDAQDSTTLLRAAHNGHLDIILSLLHHAEGSKLNLDFRGAMGRTALIVAAENGHYAIVEKLLEKKVNPNIMDYSGKKAWQKALENGHVQVVQKLLPGNPQSIENSSNEISEALLLASRKGWVELVDILISCKADKTFQNSEGRTALHLAAMNGNQAVAKRLVAEGRILAIEDVKGRTAMLQATERGFTSIVKLLLEKEDVASNIAFWKGPEALLLAAEKGYIEIVDLLVSKKVDVDVSDSSTGKTALLLAAANGNSKIVHSLLFSEADANKKDTNDRTALHYAAWGGYDDVVKTLLHGGIAPSAPDKRGQSALHLAAERASKDVVLQLLNGKADPNGRSGDGQTALHRAAWGGSVQVASVLLEWGANANISDNSNSKPWQIAAEKGHQSIVEMLLGETVLRDERVLNQEALIFAARMGYEGIAKSLLERGMRTSVEDENGLTPLHWAMKQGNRTLVSLLSSQEKVVIDALDNQGQTPLFYGVFGGHIAAVEKLLERNAGINIPDKDKKMVLHHAAYRGDREIVRMLVEHKADSHARDASGKKAWELAADQGHHDIFRLLLKKEVNFRPNSQRVKELFLDVAQRGLKPMVQLLIEKGVAVNTTIDGLGRTAIGIAAEHNRKEVLDVLMSYGADPGIPDLRSQTPILWAAKTGNVKMVSSLLEYNSVTLAKGTNKAHQTSKTTPNKSSIVNHADFKQRTALLVALERGHDNVAQFLLEKSELELDVNATDITGKTALHLAAQKGKLNLVQMLLNKRAKPMLQDKLGQTALLLAAKLKHDEVAYALLEDGSGPLSLTLEDSQGQTAMLVAARRGDVEMFQKLLEKNEDITHAKRQGSKALLASVENGHRHVVSLLLSKYVNLFRQDSRERDLGESDPGQGDLGEGDSGERGPGESDLREKTGSSTLLEAIQLGVANGNKEMVETLLNYIGAELDFTVYAKVLLKLAKGSGNKEVAWLVLNKMRFH